MEGSLISFFAIFGIGILVFATVLGLLFRVTRKKGSSAAPEKPQPVRSDASERNEYLRRLREKKAQADAAEAHARHQADAHAHSHKGEEEHYEEIVGSLGDVEDEGCADLNGVRFISHDVAYDTHEGSKRDLSPMARAMVLGEVLNSPRFRCPYRRKR